MTHVLAVWLGRIFFASRPLIQPLPPKRQPMKLEVERLADYRWRDLGFVPLQRRE
jgi:hypothetical protein